MSDKKNEYGDIIKLRYPFDLGRPRMSRENRAAQFSSFAVLTGYQAQVDEAARATEERVVPDEETERDLNEKMRILRENLSEHPQITVTYFVPDEKKQGGAYVTRSVRIKKIDEFGRMLVTEENTPLPFDDIIKMEGKLFGGN